MNLKQLKILLLAQSAENEQKRKGMYSVTDIKKQITDSILEELNVNEWKQVGEDKLGVCVFSVHKDGVYKATGTLSQLREKALS